MVPTNRPGRHCNNRVFEWVAAVALLGMGVVLLWEPHSMHASKFKYVLDVFSPYVLMLYYLGVGAARVAALWANSNWPLGGSRVRSFGAALSSLVWAQMAYSLTASQQSLFQTLPPSLPLYLAMCGGELYSAWRAATDARYR